MPGGAAVLARAGRGQHREHQLAHLPEKRQESRLRSSKAAVVGPTKELAVELGPLGVRSNAVAPSFVLTPFNSQRKDLADLDAMVARYVAFTPLRRLIEPTDVANAVAFLASERARNITWEVIHVCAGSQLPPSV